MIDLASLLIGERIGAGGEGRVFRAAAAADGTQLAVKLIEVASDAERTVQARLAALRSDPDDSPVVPFLTSLWLREAPGALKRQLPSAAPNTLVLVMPFVDGASLGAILESGPLTARELAALLLGVARKLSRLPPGLAHGDLRSANLLVRRRGEVALIDPRLDLEPAPEVDLRAFGALGQELLGAAESPDLSRFLSELGGDRPPSASESGERLALLSVALGVPAAGPESVLAPRVAAVSLAMTEAPTKPLPAALPPRRWTALWATAGLCALALAGVAGLSGVRPHRNVRTTITGNGMFEGGERLFGGGGHVHPASAGPELSFEESADPEDGLIQAKIVEPVPGIALLTPRGKELWRRDGPELGSTFYLDLKPGPYVVEVDRQTPEGIKPDKRPVMVEVRSVFRVMATNELYDAPDPGGPHELEQKRGHRNVPFER